MPERDASLEERMTPEERELFERFKQQIGKEFVVQECVPQYAEEIKRRSYLTGYDENVTWSGIKRWAIVNEDFNPLWFNEERAKKSKRGGIIAPPLFILAINDGVMPAAWLAAEVYRLDQVINTEKYPNFVGALHGNNEWEFFKPVRPDDKIQTKSKCTDIYWKQGKQYRLLLTFGETTYTNQKGQLVAHSKTGAVYRFK